MTVSALTLDAQSIAPFRTDYAPDDVALVKKYIAETRLEPDAEARIDATATRYVEHMRASHGGIGGVEDFMREFGLTTREGLAMMILAEALLRVPDSATADKLIEDKLKAAAFDQPGDVNPDTWLVSASAWALGLTSRILKPGDTPKSVFGGLIKRIGMPAVRTATRQAMRILGHQFVLGQTVPSALKRARTMEAKGYRYSYDLLGEGARTSAYGEDYFQSYVTAMKLIGEGAGKDTKLPNRPGVSIKLSALHPRYEAVNDERLKKELIPRVLDLVRIAREQDLNITIDAEEANRLEISLDVVAAVIKDPVLEGWGGFGLAIQAYQRRAQEVVDWVVSMARAHNRRLMVRLVKGAYWDTEIKMAQEKGLPDFPVFTRKAATDLSYLACARHMLDARDVLYPQFASHNALTNAYIQEYAGPDGKGTFEFQRLHGMGEALFHSVVEEDKFPCRIYAPIGGHKDLLAYLVRRLLENGANSSFVSLVGNSSVPVATLLKRPAVSLEGGERVRNSSIPLPKDLFADQRANSSGMDFGYTAEREALLASVSAVEFPTVSAKPLVPGVKPTGAARMVRSPVDGKLVVGDVIEADAAMASQAMDVAVKGFAAWSRVPVENRARMLERTADLLEENRGRLMAILAMEAGKTLGDGLAEVREAADFCRYYAGEARRLFSEPRLMPGPTGEENRYTLRGRGAFVCISPWNFPLAIFMGQITAALAAGNTVVAKPAEQTPLVGYEAIKLLHAAGVPEDAALFLPGDGKIGAALTADPKVAGVAFTGSTETAWAINQSLAAKRGPIVPLIAETGGINAMLVDATALPEQVCDDVMTSAFRSAGQRCSALRLLFLQEDVADDMIDMMAGAAAELALGDPRLATTDVGPLIDAEARENVLSHVREMEKSQKIRYAGPTPEGELAGGTWVAPHIVELDKAEALTREVFGPVLHIVRYKADELDKVLESIAATGYGLTLGVHSRIEATIAHVIDKLPVGNVYINRNTIGAIVGSQPFGGSGLSGTGPKAGGPAYLQRYALEQVVSVNTAASGGNARLLAQSGDE